MFTDDVSSLHSSNDSFTLILLFCGLPAVVPVANLDHECSICNARFSSGGHLKQHMRIHDTQQLAEHRHQILTEIVTTGYGEFIRPHITSG